MEALYGLLLPFLGTSLGAASVFFMKKAMSDGLQKGLTGFAAGVMTAASVWSLLIPAIERSEELGKWSFAPAAAGLWLGFLFLLALDHIIPHLHWGSAQPGGPLQPAAPDHHDGAGGNAPQHSGGDGGGRGLRRISGRGHGDHCYGRAGAFPGHRCPEFPGGSHRLHAPAGGG